MYKLRELERNDLVMINKWRNATDIIACLETSYRYINEGVESNLYDNYLHNISESARCAQ